MECIQPALGISGKCPVSMALHISLVYEKRLRVQSLHEQLQCFRHLSHRGISHTCIYSPRIYPIYTSLVSEISIDGIVILIVIILPLVYSPDLSGACIWGYFFSDEL